MDADTAKELGRLENLITEQAFEIKSLRNQLAEQDEATRDVFRAVIHDIDYLQKNKKDNFYL